MEEVKQQWKCEFVSRYVNFLFIIGLEVLSFGLEISNRTPIQRKHMD